MTEYLLYLGTIPCWCYLVLLRLVSTFLHVGPVQITRGLLPTRFFCIICCMQYIICILYYIYYNYAVKKGEISGSFLGKITYVITNYIKNYI